MINFATTKMGDGVLRALAQDDAIFGERVIEIALAPISGGARAEYRRGFGVEFERLGVILDRPIPIRLGFVSAGAVEIGRDLIVARLLGDVIDHAGASGDALIGICATASRPAVFRGGAGVRDRDRENRRESDQSAGINE